MSRIIEQGKVLISPEFKETSEDKLILIKKPYKGCPKGPTDPVLMARIRDNRLTFLSVDRAMLLSKEDKKHMDLIGDIYVAQVSNIVSKQGIFVRVREGKAGTDEEKAKTMGYLELPKNAVPVFCDERSGEGRCLNVGDPLLVQVRQLPQKNKLMTLSSCITLPGRFFVLDTSACGIFYSAKLSKADKQHVDEQIKEELSSYLADFPCRILIRTKAVYADKDKLLGEIAYLHGLLKKILTQGRRHSLFSCIYKGADPFSEYLLRKCDTLPGEIVTDDPSVLSECKSLLKEDGLEEEIPVRLYETSGVSLSQVYGLKDKIQKCLNRTVWLKGGGCIVIDQTEAMTVIDVNSSKDIKKEHKNATVSRVVDINLEAASEAIEQIRLRNLSGMILIDFINMDAKSIPVFLDGLRKILKSDLGRTRFIDYTKLGICEFTREKQDKPLSEELVDICMD